MMTQTAATQDHINITPDVTEKNSQGKPFFTTTLWFIFIGAGLGVGYYAWQTTQKTENYIKAEFALIKQDITTLKDAYSELLRKQTPTQTALTQKVNALETKMLEFSSATPQTAAPAPDYLTKILALIALKDMAHKIEAGVSIKGDVKILEQAPTSLKIDLPLLKEASTKRFVSLDQLQYGLRVFEDFAEKKKGDETEKSLITQMGDFLKITRTDEVPQNQLLTQSLTDADAALEADDVHQARQILSATFPEEGSFENWYKDAASYLEGRELRTQLEGWASELFENGEEGEAL